jgi:hypothetical protein
MSELAAQLHQEVCDIAFDEDINTRPARKYYPTNDDRADAYAEALRDIRSLLGDPRWAEVIE